MDSSGLKEDIFYSSSWMQEILEISNIGLWLLEINILALAAVEAVVRVHAE